MDIIISGSMGEVRKWAGLGDCDGLDKNGKNGPHRLIYLNAQGMVLCEKG